MAQRVHNTLENTEKKNWQIIGIEQIAAAATAAVVEQKTQQQNTFAK